MTFSKPLSSLDSKKHSEINMNSTDEAAKAIKEVSTDDDHLSRPITVIFIGAGSRGTTYAEFARVMPSWMKIIAVAEPDPQKRELFRQAYDIDTNNAYEDWKPIAAKPKMADAVFICTLDHQHFQPAVTFAGLQYHIFLEKPMSVSISECAKITAAAEAAGTVFAIGHVLRYSPFHRRIKEILDTKELGEIINIQHVEPVGWYHFAHSYVRGNWHKEADSTFSLMGKCCHDIDLLQWWTGLQYAKVSSFGSLTCFNKDNKPTQAGSSTQCLECPLQDTCQFSAKTIYMKHKWHTSILSPSRNISDIEEAVKTGPYGRCVYEMDNDVCDNQVVNIQFQRGERATPTATLTMIATSNALCQRKVRIYCSNGDIEADEEQSYIKVTNFSTRSTISINPYKGNTITTGHGGSDMGIVRSFLLAIDAYKRGDYREASDRIPPAREALNAHLFVFAAEHARKTGTVVDVDQFIREQIKEATEN
ncbi:hypothetical protein NQZ79_g8440 [Umbelopsis isabellina]|nr:hypothetical protein NQZ79_g8440 [Umbelopsis isabellina]